MIQMEKLKQKDMAIEILQASQFFEVGDRTWAELKAMAQKAGEGGGFTYGSPWLRYVRPDERPIKGEVWYREGRNGRPEVYLADYDSSG